MNDAFVEKRIAEYSKMRKLYQEMQPDSRLQTRWEM